MSGYYSLAGSKVANGQFQWTANLVRIALVTGEYTFSSGHEFLSSVPSTSVVQAAALTGRRVSGADALANPVVFLRAGPSDVVGAVLYAAKATREASPLIAYWNLNIGADLSDLTLEFVGDRVISATASGVITAPTIAKTSQPRVGQLSLISLDPFLRTDARVRGEAFYELTLPRATTLYGLIWVAQLDFLGPLCDEPVRSDTVTGSAKTDEPLAVRKALAVTIAINLARLYVAPYPGTVSWSYLDVTGVRLVRKGQPVNQRGLADGGGIAAL